MKRLLVVLSLVAATSLTAAPPTRPYHLELEADPAAPFPFLAKFGKVQLSLYNGGVRAETVWLNGFSRTGSPSVTVMNPYGRIYTDMALAQIGSTVAKMAGADAQRVVSAGPTLLKPVPGKVKGIDAARYRLQYAPEAWIDLWTTRSIPENAQFKRVVTEFVDAISPGTAAMWKSVPGTPVYVELNFSHYKKLPLLRLKSLAYSNQGEQDALNVGTLYFKAPLLDAILK